MAQLDNLAPESPRFRPLLYSRSCGAFSLAFIEANQRRVCQSPHAGPERAPAQVSDERFFANLDTEANSVGTLMQHIGGNLRSRWRDFRTTDGGPIGSAIANSKRACHAPDVQAKWRREWTMLQVALDGLTPADLETPIVIRGQSASLPQRADAQSCTSPVTCPGSSCS